VYCLFVIYLILCQVPEEALVITSDQVIVYEGQVREKPEDESQCREFLRSYASHPAEAIVGVAVTNTKTGSTFFSSLPLSIKEEDEEMLS
jgi:predicted house-cleaning NTP pyrophosphatase (Maf/HAM1 superfamily)